jgi:hypothetical protein
MIRGEIRTSDEAVQNPALSAAETSVLSSKEVNESDTASDESGDIQEKTALYDTLPYSADFGQIGATRFELATSASRTQRSKPG